MNGSWIVVLFSFVAAACAFNGTKAQSTAAMDGIQNIRQDDAVSGLIESSESHQIMLFGEEHQESRHSQFFVSYLRAMEAKSPGRVKMVGLEVFDKYQPAVNAFLASCDVNFLAETPDQEALRGHKGDDVVRNFKAVYGAICDINQTRKGPKIKIVAIDRAPDPQSTFKQWQQSHSMPDLLRWAISRDSFMLKNIKASISENVGDLSVVFVGSAHIQKSGVMQVTTPSGDVDVKWLGTRLAEAFDTLSVAGNDPYNDCIDGIEKALTATNDGTSPLLVDLRQSPLGEFESFRCPEELPVPYRFLPATYKARDHYDLYVFFRSQNSPR